MHSTIHNIKICLNKAIIYLQTIALFFNIVYKIYI